MTLTIESMEDDRCGGRRHGSPTEEERRQRAAEFKQEFLDEYRKQHGDALISAEQTWELYQIVEERWHAKMKERRSHPSHRGGPHHFEEKRKQILSGLQQDFQNDFSTAHGTDNVSVDQAWSLIQKVQQTKHEKWQADRQKHGFGHGHGHRHGHGFGHGRGHGHGHGRGSGYGRGPRHGSGDRARCSPPASQ